MTRWSQWNVFRKKKFWQIQSYFGEQIHFSKLLYYSFIRFVSSQKFIHYAATIWKSFACARHSFALPFILITFPWFIDYIFRNKPFFGFTFEFWNICGVYSVRCRVGWINPITRWDVIYCWQCLYVLSYSRKNFINGILLFWLIQILNDDDDAYLRCLRSCRLFIW